MYALEAVVSAVVGIGHIQILGLLLELAQPPHLGAGSGRRADLLQAAQVLRVHRDDQIESVQIVEPDLARAARESKSASFRDGARTRVGFLAYMPRADAGGIDLDAIAQPGSRDLLPEDAFGERRSTDVAHADEQHSNTFGFHAPNMRATSPGRQGLNLAPGSRSLRLGPGKVDLHRLSCALVLLAIASCNTPEEGCVLDGEPVELPTVMREASGVAASRAHDDVLWIHNDSDGGARIFAVDARGDLLATIDLPEAQNRDWEDIAVARCPIGGPDGDCIYLGDIGDNRAVRDDGVGLWVLPEPEPRDAVVAEVAFIRIRYPDGPRDAEAFVITDDRALLLVSKGREHPITVYRARNLAWPESGSALGPLTLDFVQQLSPQAVDLPLQVTGASLARGGTPLALRSYGSVQFYTAGVDTLEALLPEAVPLDHLGEPQGEGIALGRGSRVFLVSEAGPQGIAPRLTRLRCRIP